MDDADGEVVDEFARDMGRSALQAWAGLVAVIAFRLRDVGAAEAGRQFLSDIDAMLGDAVPSAPGYETLSDRIATVREALERNERKQRPKRR